MSTPHSDALAASHAVLPPLSEMDELVARFGSIAAFEGHETPDSFVLAANARTEYFGMRPEDGVEKAPGEVRVEVTTSPPLDAVDFYLDPRTLGQRRVVAVSRKGGDTSQVMSSKGYKQVSFAFFDMVHDVPAVNGGGGGGGGGGDMACDVPAVNGGDGGGGGAPSTAIKLPDAKPSWDTRSDALTIAEQVARLVEVKLGVLQP